MVKVYFDGHLSKELGEPNISLKVRNFKECLSAINANFSNFRDAFIKCARRYLIIIDNEICESCVSLNKKIKESIRFVPIISGSFVFIPTISALATALSVSFFTATLIYIGTTALITLGTTALMASLRDPGDAALQTDGFIFTEADNVSSQGGVVPIGYGRYRLGSRVISSSLTSIDKNTFQENVINKIESNENIASEQSKFGNFSVNND